LLLLLFIYRLSPETFGYTIIQRINGNTLRVYSTHPEDDMRHSSKPCIGQWKCKGCTPHRRECKRTSN